MKQKELDDFINALAITQPIVGVTFLENVPSDYEHQKDTACTALARVFLNKETIYFNSSSHRQLCSGANYFLQMAEISEHEAISNYVEDEQVFASAAVCEDFLKSLPQFPKNLIGKTIRLKPLTIEEKNSVVVLLLNPAQVGRILGLLNYEQHEKAEITPSQSTCVSIFAPLVTKKPHLNFIDYYDRYYQGKVQGKNIWPEGMMILSLAYDDFEKVLSSLYKSAHGLFVPAIKPREVDGI